MSAPRIAYSSLSPEAQAAVRADRASREKPSGRTPVATVKAIKGHGLPAEPWKCALTGDPIPLPPRRVTAWAPCIPVAKARPRLGKGGHTYTPAASERGAAVQASMLRPATPDAPLVGPLSVLLAYVMPIPASWSRKQREMAAATPAPFHAVKPDVDNLAKQTLDVLSRLNWWGDDSQVARLEVSKRYGSEPGVRVSVEELRS